MQAGPHGVGCGVWLGGKAAPLQNTINCTIPFQSFTSPFGTFTIEGSVTGFLTPR